MQYLFLAKYPRFYSIPSLSLGYSRL